MQQQTAAKWYGVFLAGLIVVAGVVVIAYVVRVTIAMYPTNFGGWGLAVFAVMFSGIGLAVIGAGVWFLIETIADK